MSKKWQEEAAYFEAHRDDPNEWGDPVEAPVVSARKGLGVSITVRFSPPEAEAIRRTAKQEGMTYSEIVRKAVERYVKPEYVFYAGQNISLPVLDVNVPKTMAGAPAHLDWSVPSGVETRSSAASEMELATAAD